MLLGVRRGVITGKAAVLALATGPARERHPLPEGSPAVTRHELPTLPIRRESRRPMSAETPSFPAITDSRRVPLAAGCGCALRAQRSGPRGCPLRAAALRRKA